jgi:DNA-binding XRE family transcriptional regulator
MPDATKILDTLKTARQIHKMSRNKAAQHLGYCLQTLTRLEHGDRSARLQLVMEYANLFGYELRLVKIANKDNQSG